MGLVESPSRSRFLIEHDLFGKPLRTFLDHALGSGARRCPSSRGSIRRAGGLFKRYRNSANIADPANLPQFLDCGFLSKSLIYLYLLSWHSTCESLRGLRPPVADLGRRR